MYSPHYRHWIDKPFLPKLKNYCGKYEMSRLLNEPELALLDDNCSEGTTSITVRKTIFDCVDRLASYACYDKTSWNFVVCRYLLENGKDVRGCFMIYAHKNFVKVRKVLPEKQELELMEKMFEMTMRQFKMLYYKCWQHFMTEDEVFSNRERRTELVFQHVNKYGEQWKICNAAVNAIIDCLKQSVK